MVGHKPDTGHKPCGWNSSCDGSAEGPALLAQVALSVLGHGTGHGTGDGTGHGTSVGQVSSNEKGNAATYALTIVSKRAQTSHWE